MSIRSYKNKKWTNIRKLCEHEQLESAAGSQSHIESNINSLLKSNYVYNETTQRQRES